MTDLEKHVNQPGRAKLVKRVREKINELGITYIYYQFISVTGRVVGKGIPADHWERTAEKGFQLVYGSTANLFVDRHKNYIGYGPEAMELVGIPDPETFCQLPWDKRIGRVFVTCFRNREERKNPGGHLTSDCRGNLRIFMNEFKKKHGLELRVGTEPEMMWLTKNPDGTPTGQGFSKPFCYHIDQFESLRPVFMKVIEYAKAMGLDMIQGDHEDAPGQLELNWTFDNVTGPSSDSGDPSTKDSFFYVDDYSSGSSGIVSSDRYGWMTPVVMNQHSGKGDNFLPPESGDVNPVVVKYLSAARNQQPEVMSTSDAVQVLRQDDDKFTREHRIVEHFYALEKSMYQIISEEMINMFASVVDFNNLIGDPVNRYRQEYKDLSKLRQLFFERIGNTPDLDRFIEYYKWIDFYYV